MDYKVYGVLGVEAIHSNFNSNFEGEPKNIQGGQLFCSEYSIKYAIKALANAYGENVIGLKRVGDDGFVYTLEQTYNEIFDTKLSKNTKKKKLLKTY